MATLSGFIAGGVLNVFFHIDFLFLTMDGKSTRPDTSARDWCENYCERFCLERVRASEKEDEDEEEYE